jgi:hypothetical protein
MKRVFQKHRTGCVVACLAMIFGISYEEALKLSFPDKKPYQRLFFNLERISRILKQKGASFKVHLVDLNDLNLYKIKNPSILCLYLNKPARTGHAVILNNKKILDPSRNTRRTLRYCQKNVYAIFEIIKP